MTSVTTHRITKCECESNMSIFDPNPKEKDTLFIYLYIRVCVCYMFTVFQKCVTHFYWVPTDGSLVMILLKICHVHFRSVIGYAAHVGKMLIHPKFGLENLKGRQNLEYQGIGSRVTLKWILRKIGTEFVWFWIRFNSRLLWCVAGSLDFIVIVLFNTLGSVLTFIYFLLTFFPCTYHWTFCAIIWLAVQ